MWLMFIKTCVILFNYFHIGMNKNLTTVQWKNYCDTLYAVSVAATNVLKSGKPINFW